ncbi:FkbM family methyltransferase [Aquamicrobium segne]|uniref:FkbM family methyltransferase n=1 Tax=Aquamicrobium segne TaxID=469547 RepID=A0ABW0GUF3_9HYPH
MKPTSRICLFVAKLIPRGYFRILKFAAERDPALQDLFLPLKNIPLCLRGDLRESVFTSLYRTGNIPHQAGFDLLCTSLLRPGDLVFDIGANIGYTTALFSHIVGSDGRVIAVEPSPRSFALLSRSLGEKANITLLNLGVSKAEGQLEFYVPPSLDRASFIPIAGAQKLRVTISSLDNLCASYGYPQFIKVDVEGYEPSVFSGAVATLHRNDRPIIVFEALDIKGLEKCIFLLSEQSGGDYEYRRIRNDGSLVKVEETGSSDFVAIPKWAKERIDGRTKVHHAA